jgi:hypothetical protein
MNSRNGYQNDSSNCKREATPVLCAALVWFGGTGGLGSGRRQAHGQYSYSWQEERAHVTHRLILHAGHDIDIVERLEITVDARFLLYEQELYSGSRVVKRKEEFPAAEGEVQS